MQYRFPDVFMVGLTKTEERSHTVIMIDGQLSGESVTILETCCSQAQSNRQPAHFFLRHETTVDHAGTIVLRRLAVKGTGLEEADRESSCPWRDLDTGN
jgi:hypothetical protein